MEFAITMLIALATAEPSILASVAPPEHRATAMLIGFNPFLDMGSSEQGEVLMSQVRLTNNYKTPIRFTKVRGGTGPVEARMALMELKPGESSHLLVRIDTRRFVGLKFQAIYISFVGAGMEEQTARVFVSATSSDIQP